MFKIKVKLLVGSGVGGSGKVECETSCRYSLNLMMVLHAECWFDVDYVGAIILLERSEVGAQTLQAPPQAWKPTTEKKSTKRIVVLSFSHFRLV